MEKQKNGLTKKSVMRITLVTLVMVVIFSSIFGAVLDKDRIHADIQRLRSTMSIAQSMGLHIVFQPGYMMMHRPGETIGPKIPMPTLTSAVTDGNRIQLQFKSILFRDSIEIDNVIETIAIPPRLDQL